MVAVVRIEITNPELLTRYADLLRAQGKGKESKTSKVTEFEEAISRTLFRGTTIKGTAGGVSAPDWFVTDSGMISLMKSVAGEQIVNTQKFNDWVKQDIGNSESVSIEGKMLQSDNKSGGIKIGNLTVEPSNDAITNSFDIFTNSVIDVTRHSLIKEMRENWAGASENFFTSDASSGKRKELSPKGLNKSKLSDFNRILGKTISADLQKFLNTDGTYIELRGLMEKAHQGTIDIKTPEKKELIKLYVNTINNRYIKDGFLHELQVLQKEGKLFDSLLKTPAIRAQFYQKSRNLAIFRKTNTSINGLLLTFSPADFNSKFFGAKFDVSSGAISVYLKSEVETQFLTQFPKEAAVIRLGQNLHEFDKAVQALAVNNTKGSFDYLGEKITYLIPTGGSIPMSKAFLKFSSKVIVADPFTYINKQSAINNPNGRNNDNMGTFISAEYLRLLVVKRMVEKMPVGPVGGPPLSHNKLTYRTGRFANSVQLMVNYRKKLVSYYYNPIYYIHEQTSRNPKILIERSINEVLLSRFKQKFMISEVGRF